MLSAISGVVQNPPIQNRTNKTVMNLRTRLGLSGSGASPKYMVSPFDGSKAIACRGMSSLLAKLRDGLVARVCKGMGPLLAQYREQEERQSRS